jgi:hypothetical protein
VPLRADECLGDFVINRDPTYITYGSMGAISHFCAKGWEEDFPVFARC